MREKVISRKKLGAAPFVAEREYKMMTKREFYAQVIALNAGEVSDFARNEIEKMDRTNEKRRNAPKKDSKAAQGNREYFGRLEDFLVEPHTASEIGAHLEVSAQKASAIMKQAVKEGFAQSADIKVKGRAVKSYHWVG